MRQIVALNLPLNTENRISAPCVVIDKKRSLGFCVFSVQMTNPVGFPRLCPSYARPFDTKWSIGSGMRLLKVVSDVTVRCTTWISEMSPEFTRSDNAIAQYHKVFESGGPVWANRNYCRHDKKVIFEVVCPGFEGKGHSVVQVSD